ncbi:MAG: ATP-binding protein [Acidobacteriota bacterium]
MDLPTTSEKRLRGLLISLSLTWFVTWSLGVGLLAVVAVGLNERLLRQDLDSRLALEATAAYGLAYFDAEGVFHDELLQLDAELFEDLGDLWILVPGSPPVVHLAPEDPLLPAEALADVVARVVADETDHLGDLSGADGSLLRVHAMPTYRDGVQEPAHAAIVVVADPGPPARAHAAFARKITFLSLGIGALGIVVGLLLARWSLRPAIQALTRGERFLVATAHELRTPVASLLATCESGLAGDEPADRALERAARLATRTGEAVDQLLLHARLDAGHAELRRQPLRLDLLVEACCPETDEVVLETTESIVEADEVLVRVAVRNLLDNALAQSDGPPRVTVHDTTIVVEDDGPGYPAVILELARGPFAAAPSSGGAGIGLATCKMIAELHGGDLILTNRPEGGARAVLELT